MLHNRAGNLNFHFTDMTGRKRSSDKIPLTEFEIEVLKTVKLCSGKHTPFRTGYHEGQGTLTAHFSLFGGKQCPFKDQCIIKFNKKDAVLRIDRKSILAAQEREKLNCKK